MIRVALQLARADVRRSPGRAAAVAALLLVAVLLPEILRSADAVGLLLAAVVAGSATTGLAAHHERRARILTECGADTGTQMLVAVAALVIPGAFAAAAGTVIGFAVDGSVALGPALLIGLAVPVVVGAATAWATAPGASLGRRGTAAVAVLIALTMPLLVVPLLLLAALVGRRRGRAAVAVRVAVTVVSVVVTVGAAALMSLSESFFDLGLAFLATAIPLTVAVGWLGATAVGLAAAGIGRLGPTARLATVPLARRRRQVGPVAAVVALVVTLAAAEGVVGASFEAREARRPPPEVLGVAGTRADQAIVVATGVTPDGARRLVAEAVTGTPVQVAVIDRIGGGASQAVPDGARDPDSLLDLGGAVDLAPQVSVPVADGPSWVGVVAPDALAPLGLAAHAEALARGEALVLNPEADLAAGQVVITGGDVDPLRLPAVVVSERLGLLLPAVLVSESRGAELGGDRNGARVVVVPGPGAGGDQSARVAAVIGSRLADTASARVSTPELDATTEFVAMLERALAVADGDSQIRKAPVAPLDQVPAFARTAEQGWSRAVTFGALAVLVALAGTLLVLGGTRTDDAVLLIQGAPDRLRIATAVVQTSTVALAGTVLGAAVGLGIPALAFSLYNRRERDARTLDIPYDLPPTVVALLVALPLVAALLAAAVVAARGRAAPARLAEAARA